MDSSSLNSLNDTAASAHQQLRHSAEVGELAGRLGQLAGGVGTRGDTLVREVRAAPWEGAAASAFRSRLTSDCAGVEESARHLRGAASAMDELAGAMRRRAAS